MVEENKPNQAKKVPNIDKYIRRWFLAELVQKYFHQDITNCKDYHFENNCNMSATSPKIEASYEFYRSSKDIKNWYIKEFRYLKSSGETKITTQKLQYSFDKLVPIDKKTMTVKGLIKNSRQQKNIK